MTLGEQRRKALELLAPRPSRRDHSGVVRPLSYSRPHQAGTTTPMAASRASRGGASSKPSIFGVLAERHARHLAERAQTLQDARKPMHTYHLGDLLSENNARTVSNSLTSRSASPDAACPAGSLARRPAWLRARLSILAAADLRRQHLGTLSAQVCGLLSRFGLRLEHHVHGVRSQVTSLGEIDLNGVRDEASFSNVTDWLSDDTGKSFASAFISVMWSRRAMAT